MESPVSQGQAFQARRPSGSVPRVGARVEVYWEQDDMWYSATVVKAVNDYADFTNELHYDDGDVEMLDMRLETWRISRDPVAPKSIEQVSSATAAASSRGVEKQRKHPPKIAATTGGSAAGKPKRAQETGPTPGSTGLGTVSVERSPVVTPAAAASLSNGLSPSNKSSVVPKPDRTSSAMNAKRAPDHPSHSPAVGLLDSKLPLPNSGSVTGGKMESKSTPSGNGTLVPITVADAKRSKMDFGGGERSSALSDKMEFEAAVVTKKATDDGGNDAIVTVEPQGSVALPSSKDATEKQSTMKQVRKPGDLATSMPGKHRSEAVKSGGPSKRRRSDPSSVDIGRPRALLGSTPVSSPQDAPPVLQQAAAQAGTAGVTAVVSPAKASAEDDGNLQEPNLDVAPTVPSGATPGKVAGPESPATTNLATGSGDGVSRTGQEVPTVHVTDEVPDKPSAAAQEIPQASTSPVAPNGPSHPPVISPAFTPSTAPGVSSAMAVDSSQPTALGVVPDVAPSAPGPVHTLFPGATSQMVAGGGPAPPPGIASGSGIASAYNPSSSGAMAGGASAPPTLVNGQVLGRGNAPSGGSQPGNSGPSVSVLSLDNVLSAVVQTVVLVMDQRVRPIADRLDALTNEVRQTRAFGLQTDVPLPANGTPDIAVPPNNSGNLIEVVKQQHEDHVDQLSKLRREVKKLRAEQRTVVNEVVSARDADLKRYISECTQYAIEGGAASTGPGTFAPNGAARGGDGGPNHESYGGPYSGSMPQNVDAKVEFPLQDFGGRQALSSRTPKERVLALASRQVTMWLLETQHECQDPKRVTQWSSETASICLAAAAEQLRTFDSSDQAFSRLVDGLGGDNVELSWFLNPAVPEGLSDARVNYSAWDPPPNDEEWVIEEQLLAEIAARFHDVLAVADLSESTDELATAVGLARAAAQLPRSHNDRSE